MERARPARRPRLAPGLSAILVLAVVVPGCAEGAVAAGYGASQGIRNAAADHTHHTTYPAVTSLNRSSVPTSAVGETLEIDGQNLFGNECAVAFQQGDSAPIVVGPLDGATDTHVVVRVPGGLSAPGSVRVSVSNSTGGASNAVDLALTGAVFDAAIITWVPATPLPSPLRAHAAVAVPVDATRAWVYVIGGNDGSATANVASVVVASLDATGNLGAWRETSPLPSGAAFLAAAEADATSSPVPAGQAFVYAIGGQATPDGAPGGTASVLAGKVTLETGDISWTPTTPLPEPRVGCRAVVARGFLHVTGGLAPSGAAIAATASAKVQADGTLGAFVEPEAAALPVPVAFHESFFEDGVLYVLMGDRGPRTAPFGAGAASATPLCVRARVDSGAVGSFAQTGRGLADREKLVALHAAGQVLVYEGATPLAASEGERSILLGSGDLGAFIPQTGSALPGLGTFDGAGVAVSLAGGSALRLLLLGGDSLASPGTPTSAVASSSP